VKEARGRGRPPLCPAEVRAQVVALRAEGHSLRRIARELNAAGVPSPAGGSWSHSGVDDLLHTRHVMDYAESVGTVLSG
jgi:hypothetical protein